MNKKNLSVVISLAFLAFVTFCSSNYFGRILTRSSTNDPVNAVCSSDNHCTDNFEQPTEPGTFAPEIVFVGDTSGSMSDNFDKIAKSLPQWLKNIRSQGIENFCVGYMPAHAGVYSGLYYAPEGYPKCMCFEDYGEVDTIASNLAYIFSHPPTRDNNADGSSTFGGGEHPLFSLHNSLTDSNKIKQNQAAGCFRPAYTVAPILISDENDTIASFDGTLTANSNCPKITIVNGVDVKTIQFDNSVFPAAATDGWVSTPASAPNYNGGLQCTESLARFAYYSKQTPTPAGKYELAITPESVANELVAFNQGFPSFGTGMGYKPMSGKAPFHGGIEFADQFGQQIADLSYSDVDNQAGLDAELNKITDALTKVVTFHYSFTLASDSGNKAAVCERRLDSLEVKVNGKTVDSSQYTLSTDRTTVVFDKAYSWSYGDSVVISFMTCES